MFVYLGRTDLNVIGTLETLSIIKLRPRTQPEEKKKSINQANDYKYLIYPLRQRKLLECFCLSRKVAKSPSGYFGELHLTLSNKLYFGIKRVLTE